MGEWFLTFDALAPGDALYVHRCNLLYPWLGKQRIAASSLPSEERIGVAVADIPGGSLVVVDGPDLRRGEGGPVVGDLTPSAAEPPACDAPLPRDHLIAACLARETAAIGKGYVRERHTDFDVEHLWRVTMEMGRGG